VPRFMIALPEISDLGPRIRRYFRPEALPNHRGIALSGRTGASTAKAGREAQEVPA